MVATEMGGYMHKWEEFYRLAALEVDGKKMPERVAAARETIRERLDALSRNGNHHEDRRRLTNALKTLDVLETDARNW